ncbi:MAG: WYL domain-containing protein [Actinobacteria bacterium]|nr:WYL domain-containing protein [Actinomycetota bacterium]
MSEASTTRTARALDLVPFLLENQGISVEELADEFRITQMQILEDLNLLFVCGLPGYSPLELIDMNFEDGYVTVSDPQVLDRPRKLSKPELTTLLVSLEVMKTMANPDVRQELEGLQVKLRAVLDLKPTIDVVVNEPADAKLDEILQAIVRGCAVEINYLSAHSDKESWRTIIPNRVYVEGKHTYIESWCITSQGERVFRLDRILAIRKSDQAFSAGVERRDHEPGDDYLLFVSDNARIFIEENSAVIANTEKISNGYEVLVTAIDQDWLVRTIAGFGPEIAVLNPPALKAALSGHLAAIRSLYQ